MKLRNQYIIINLVMLSCTFISSYNLKQTYQAQKYIQQNINYFRANLKYVELLRLSKIVENSIENGGGSKLVLFKKL